MKRGLPYVCLPLVAVLLTVLEGDVLYRIQEQSLFLNTPLFFRQCVASAGGLLTWVGAWFTQFLYYPMVGAGLLCLLWALLMWLLGRTFRLSDRWMSLTLVPVACLLIANVELGYWIFYLKLRGYYFDATVGTIAAVGLAWIYRALPRKPLLSTCFIPVATAVGYAFFGFFGLLSATLMGVMAVRRHWADSLVALVAVVAVPLVSYHTLFCDTHIGGIYWAALPTFAVRQECYPRYYLPYAGLVVSTLLLAAIPPHSNSKTTLAICPSPPAPIKALSPLAPCSVPLILSICAALCWYRDDNFHRELAMQRSIEQHDWQQVLATARAAKDEPTRAMCMMQNLALFRTGRLRSEIIAFPQGKKRPEAPFPSRVIHTVGRRLYLEYGLTNYCYRWCMEDGVKYGWSVEKLKLMAVCALVNNEMAVAQKYLNLLRKTAFHKDWARHYGEYLRHPQRIADAPELKTIVRLNRIDDYLTNDVAQAEMFLIEHFAATRSGDPMIQELTMAAAYYYDYYANTYDFIEE